jgi:hypothetical protein
MYEHLFTPAPCSVQIVIMPRIHCIICMNSKTHKGTYELQLLTTKTGLCSKLRAYVSTDALSGLGLMQQPKKS